MFFPRNVLKYKSYDSTGTLYSQCLFTFNVDNATLASPGEHFLPRGSHLSKDMIIKDGGDISTMPHTQCCVGRE